MKKQKVITCCFILIFIFFLEMCDNIPTKISEFQKEISIVGVLDTSKKPQKIYAFYTATHEKETGFIENAIVTVYNENQNIRFHPYYDTLDQSYFYCDRPETLHVFPQLKYKLKFVTPEGDSLVGETMVPGEFNITSPVEDIVATDNSIKIVWAKSKSAYGYIINLINPPTEYPPGSGHYIYYSPECFQTNDTTYTIYRDYGFKKGKYTIKVMAYDKNYHYHHAEGISHCGVSGGYGVFASAVIDSISLLIE